MNAKILAHKEQLLDEDMHFPRFLFARLKIKGIKLQVSLIVCLGAKAKKEQNLFYYLIVLNSSIGVD